MAAVSQFKVEYIFLYLEYIGSKTLSVIEKIGSKPRDSEYYYD
jgi:hypothetical protein